MPYAWCADSRRTTDQKQKGINDIPRGLDRGAIRRHLFLVEVFAQRGIQCAQDVIDRRVRVARRAGCSEGGRGVFSDRAAGLVGWHRGGVMSRANGLVSSGDAPAGPTKSAPVARSEISARARLTRTPVIGDVMDLVA